MELRQIRLTDPLVVPLIEGLTHEYDRRYGANDEMRTVDAEEFDPPAGTFLVLTDGGAVLAGGGLRRVAGDTCEVKRMWTAAEHRRKGYASRVLTGLEDAARAAGYSTLLLETGPHQPEAIALYTGRGYRQVPCYGRYPDALAFRLDLAAAPPAELRVGCALWAHKGWQGRFLPAGSRRAAQLPAYATWCTAVEGNTTAYGLPSPATVASWAAETPAGFRFLFKLPQVITHQRRLRHAEAELRELVDLLAPLGERAEVLAVQLPAGFGPGDLGALAAFLARAPAAHRYAVEVRHPAFFDGGPADRALAGLLADRGAEWTTFDTTTLFARPPTSDAEREAWAAKPRLPRRVVAVGDRPVVRFLGRDDPDATVAGWQPWVPVVAGWLAEGRRPTVFVHTPDNDEALGLARRFHDDVRAAATVEVAPLPTPTVTAAPPTLF